MTEQEPQSYQHKHKTKIHLDNYQGVAANTMQLNTPVADSFMRTSDMRYDITIIQKPQQRTRDYEQVGKVRVAKFLELPRLNAWHRNGLVETQKDENYWVIAVDDQGLADQIAREPKSTENFNIRFTRRFQKEVRIGLQECLQREKLLNGGEYDAAFLVNYFNFIAIDLLGIPSITATEVSRGISADQVLKEVGIMYALFQVGINTHNWFMAGIRRWDENDLGRQKQSKLIPSFNEPFVKSSIPELLMPFVPVDRLARGIIYLKRYGKNLITLKE